MRGQRLMGSTTGFNGAALRGARKPEARTPMAVFTPASMGPRSEERGNLRCKSLAPSPGMLQWGRAPRSAETGTWALYLLSIMRFNGAALRGARKREADKYVNNYVQRFNGAALRGARKLAQRQNKPSNISAWLILPLREFPRSSERGPIEALHVVVDVFIRFAFPRSSERGPIEAR